MSYYVLVMRQGNIIVEGKAQHIFEELIEVYTKLLLAAAMNVKTISDDPFIKCISC